MKSLTTRLALTLALGSMLLLAVPCVILVYLAELFVWANDRRRARREAALLAAEGLSPLDDSDSVDADYRA